jgi:hypothetical protein
MDRPKKLYAVHLPKANHWMPLASGAVAEALGESYEVEQYVPVDLLRDEMLAIAVREIADISDPFNRASYAESLEAFFRTENGALLEKADELREQRAREAAGDGESQS